MTTKYRLYYFPRTSTHICKPRRPNAQIQACKRVCFLPTLGLTLLILVLLTDKAWGQNQTPKIPTATFPSYQQIWTPNQNNNLTPYQPQTGYSNPTTLNQYEKDRQEYVNRQQQLESIYRELERPNNMNVKYDLPPCSEVQGAASYQSAFQELTSMANGQKPFNLKEANFLVENAFYDNQGNYENFDKVVKQIGQFLKWKMEELNYNPNSNLAKNLILYQFFADTLEIKSKKLRHLPFQYDFQDYMGHENWNKMFVEKALASNSGQCHSLPLLYLIIADEIGAKARLSYSPSHTYIKFQADNGKWYNVELTNGMLTTDAFVLQSGYIKAEALQNKIYMQPLTEKQLISHNMFDLAKGYAKKFCYDSFVEQVINKALELDPNNINANMLKSDYLTIRFQYIERQLGINEQNFRQILPQYPIAKDIFISRNKQYAFIDNLGYEDMPPAEYEKWLNSLKSVQKKQESKEMLLNINQSLNIKK